MIALLSVLQGSSNAQGLLAVEDMALLKRMRVETERTKREGRLQAALGLLAASETGKPLAALVTSRKIRLVPDAGGAGAYFQDDTKTVYYDLEFARDAETWQTAVLLGHELEHARQSLLGVTGEEVRGAREAAAFLVQCQVWVELGGKVRPKDLPANAMNSQDMLAWLDDPLASVTALEVRAGWTVHTEVPSAKAYWNQVWDDQQAWRAAWKSRFPAHDGSAVEFVLKQALQFHHSQSQPGALQ